MPAYEIVYLNEDGSLVAQFEAQCQDDKEAKVLAHAMKLDATHQFEVWSGKELIYTRPQQAF